VVVISDCSVEVFNDLSGLNGPSFGDIFFLRDRAYRQWRDNKAFLRQNLNAAPPDSVPEELGENDTLFWENFANFRGGSGVVSLVDIVSKPEL